MARFRSTAGARRQMGRNLARINRKGSDRARDICDFIVYTIQTSPVTPYDPSPDDDGQHLRDSYHVEPAPDGSGDWMITTDVRYWAFVEFGTRQHGHAQPHIRPAIEVARQVFR